MRSENPLRDPVQRFKIYKLFDSIWPSVGSSVLKAAAAGACWHDISEAFVKWVDGVPVAHAGVIEIPLLIAGQRKKVGAIHAVCTLKEHRHQGYSRECMEDALAYCDQRYEVCQLLTDRPILYERYGFKSYPFVNYLYEVKGGSAKREKGLFRRLDASSPMDLARLYECVGQRAPVSQTIASLDPGWLLVIDEVLEQQGVKRFSICEDLETVIAYEVREGTLHLLDLITARDLEFQEILERIPESFETARLYFTPDRWPSIAFEASDFDEWVYMVRGAFPLEARKFCYPRLAES